VASIVNMDLVKKTNKKHMSKTIRPKDLVCMNDEAAQYHFRVEVAYARNDNLLFGEQIYRADATLWLYSDLAKIVCKAALKFYKTHGLRFVLYDGLRTVEAQETMMNTRRAIENPHWMEPPRLLSIPGGGGHPRAMAVDIGIENEDRALLDMGCPFDFLADNANSTHNPAHREYEHSKEIKHNRGLLDNAMIEAAENLEVELFPLPEEWWDFRLPPSFYREYAPISENDLPEEAKIMG